MTNTRRLLVMTAGLLGSAALTVGGGVALAGPAEPAPNSGDATSHPHHVHQGNGTCEDIDEQWFEGGTSHQGVHQGARSTGSGQGPDHGTCANHASGH
jgi:hypothetical protein